MTKRAPTTGITVQGGSCLDELVVDADVEQFGRLVGRTL
jgi:hypothetical protein